MHDHWVYPWYPINSSKKLTFLQHRQYIVHLSAETMWFILWVFMDTTYLFEMSYGKRLIDTIPDDFDVSKKVANTFYCAVLWFSFYVCFYNFIAGSRIIGLWDGNV